jgi:hypothetical protein
VLLTLSGCKAGSTRSEENILRAFGNFVVKLGIHLDQMEIT